MKQLVINILYWLAYASGMFKAVRFINRNNGTIIVYHSPVPEVFENHIKHLKRLYNVLSLSEYILILNSDNHVSLPKNSLIITFDDGHKNNFLLLPLFKKYEIIPTIYLTSHVICTNRRFWWLIPETKRERDDIKLLPNEKKNQLLLTKYGFSLEDEFDVNDRSALNHDEITEMNPFVDFQSHTCFHPILTRCSDKEIYEELLLSKKKLEELLSKDISHISYPNGCYNDKIISIAKSLGYISGRTTKCGFVTSRSDLFKLKIVGVSETNVKHRLELDLLGFPLLVINGRRKLLGLYKKLIKH